MTRPKFFIISSAIIFVLERVLSVMTPWPSFVFPIFVILFALLYPENTSADLFYIVPSVLFFDFFSGFTFGLLTIAILAVFLTIYLVRNFLSISGRSLVFTVVLSLVLVFEYFLLLSIKMPRMLVSQIPVILAEAIVVLIPMKFILRKFLNPKPQTPS